MHASKESLAAETIGDVYEGRLVEWGDYCAYFESIKGGNDFSRFFVGLPGDNCQAPHWGYLFKGKIRFIYPDHDEVINAGEAYYAPAGHRIECLEDAETIEFAPTAELMATMEVFARNVAAM